MATEYSWIKMDRSESRGDNLGSPARKHCWVCLPIKGIDRSPHFLLFRKLTIDNSDFEPLQNSLAFLGKASRFLHRDSRVLSIS